MKIPLRIPAIAALIAGVGGCFAPAELQLAVAPLGEEVPESREWLTYSLPRTVLRVEVTTQEVRQVPGPFWEYAERYLGVTEVIRRKTSRWQIIDVEVTPHREMDPSMAFQLHILEGEPAASLLQPHFDKGWIVDGSEPVRAAIRTPGLLSNVDRDFTRYEDLGITSNFEERTETLYKTIVTDTSFVEVPVSRTITQQKSTATKAREAADFILELRTRRFELLTGDYAYPQGEAMEATLKELDELESSYLSLFTGKTFARTERRSWFIVPGNGPSPSEYRLGVFAENLGFVPEELMEGAPLLLILEPQTVTGDLAAYFRQSSESLRNRIYVRIPDVVKLSVLHGTELLAEERISICQSGALVTRPL